MLKLLKNADVYAPQHLGQRDLLLAGERIAAISEDLSPWQTMDGVDVFDLEGAVLSPGYIDLHIHITGGGGEQGPASRVPEITLSQLTRNGVTTALGLLGTDGVTRSQENLLAKCRALNEEGITCLMLCGSYQYPSVTLTGSVARDIALIDRVVGVKVALSDHRSSTLTGQELIRLGSDARLGGLISGKPGLVVVHMGEGEGRLDPLFYALEHSDIPPGTFLPTHVCRYPALTADAVRFAGLGGSIDFTADESDSAGGTARVIARAIRELNCDPRRITMSSDACGSQPRFDETGACVGLTYTSPRILHDELLRLVQNEGIDLETALSLLTCNPARVLGLRGRKGCVCRGGDADLIAYGPDLSIQTVFARGQLMMRRGVPVALGRFES